jgi:pre-rRNA-processing protein TSR4
MADYETRRKQGIEFSNNDVKGVEESSAEEQQWAFFQAKVSKSPEQVLWYLRSADARPLWPRLDGQPKNSDIPVCSLCGSERIFEFQILPQLLYYFGVQDSTDSLDWGTIAVYSCSGSCKIQGYCEEFAWVQPGFS